MLILLIEICPIRVMNDSLKHEKIFSSFYDLYICHSPIVSFCLFQAAADAESPPLGSSRERALASFMANFFPSIASSGSGVRAGASTVVSRALNNLAQNDSAQTREGGE